MSRICEHCGHDSYYAREFPRVRDEAQYWRRQAKRLAAEVESLKLDIEFDRFRDRTDVAWLQGKVVAQRRELKKLNDAINARRVMTDQEPRDNVEVSSITHVEMNAPQESVPKRKLKIKEE